MISGSLSGLIDALTVRVTAFGSAQVKLVLAESAAVLMQTF